jgi:hypothetical protein
MGALNLFAALNVTNGSIFGTRRLRKLLQPNRFERLGNLRQDILSFIAYHRETGGKA